MIACESPIINPLSSNVGTCRVCEDISFRVKFEKFFKKEINSPDAMDLMLKIQVLDAHSFPNRLVCTEMKSSFIRFCDIFVNLKYVMYNIELDRNPLAQNPHMYAQSIYPS